jgi:hypothetical protein
MTSSFINKLEKQNSLNVSVKSLGSSAYLQPRALKQSKDSQEDHPRNGTGVLAHRQIDLPFAAHLLT